MLKTTSEYSICSVELTPPRLNQCLCLMIYFYRIETDVRFYKSSWTLGSFFPLCVAVFGAFGFLIPIKHACLFHLLLKFLGSFKSSCETGIKCGTNLLSIGDSLKLLPSLHSFILHRGPRFETKYLELCYWFALSVKNCSNSPY